MTNMLYYMNGGGDAIASQFWAEMENIEIRINLIDHFNPTIATIFNKKKILKRLNPETFDIINTPVSFDNPTIVQMQKEDGRINHAIGIMGDVIYDSNNKYTLRRTLENVNHSCRPSTFRRVYKVVQLVDVPQESFSNKQNRVLQASANRKIARKAIRRKNAREKKKLIKELLKTEEASK